MTERSQLERAIVAGEALSAKVTALRAERDAFRAVLVGAEYGNIHEIGAYSVPDAMLLGVMAKVATQKIIAERDAALARVEVLEKALRSVAELNLLPPDGHGNKWENSDLIGQEIRTALAKGETL